MSDKPSYQPIPVAEAQSLAEKYSKSIVIIMAHDPEHGCLHTTTYGVSPEDKAWAAQGGEIATRALGYSVEEKREFEDYRLAQAKKLLVALKASVQMLDVVRVLGKDVAENQRRRARINSYQDIIQEAERFLNV